MLCKDFDMVPFINNLNEDCEFDITLFNTKNNKTKNIVFSKIDK
jgi:hypothetical protein